MKSCHHEGEERLAEVWYRVATVDDSFAFKQQSFVCGVSRFDCDGCLDNRLLRGCRAWDDFIVADTPGHEQYTRNMVTGASRAELALLLADARKGVLRQTRRHAHIVSLMGIPRVIPRNSQRSHRRCSVP